MNHALTWVVNFSKNDDLRDNITFFGDTWIKYSNGYEMLGELDSTINKTLVDYFDGKEYTSILHRFWDSAVNFNSEKFNLIVIADRDSLFLSAQFAIEFKRSRNFLVDIGLPANSFKNSFLISFWEHSWSNSDYEKSAFGLYELSLYQNSIPIHRPFDSVYFYKNTNEGLNSYGKYYETNDIVFHSSRILQLISYLSIASQSSSVNDNVEKWARSFGGLLIYNDTEQIYKINAEKISAIIFDSILKKEQGSWAIDFYSNKLESHTNDFDCTKIFHKITASAYSTQDVIPLNYQNAWDWFSLKNLKLFFEDFIGGILFKTKQVKLSFVEKSYKEVKDKIDENLRKIKSQPDALGIASPQSIFNSYFKQKPYSIAALRLGLGELIKLVQEKRNGLLNFYNAGYKINEEVFFPFGLDEESKKELDVLIHDFNGRDDLALIESEKAALNSINEVSASLPHPISILSKNFILGTLFVMMAYVPLMSLFDSLLGKVIGYSILSLLFILPTVLGWYKYRNALRKISTQRLKYEVLVKYNLSRRVNTYLFRKIDDFFDSYLKSCASFLSDIESFQKNEIPQEFETLHQEENTYFSIKPLSSVVNKIPEVLVSIDTDGSNLKISELLNSEEYIFKFYRNLVEENELNIEKILVGGYNELNTVVEKNMTRTKGNSSNIANVVFGSKLNLRQEIIHDLLNAIPPYNGTEDYIKWEVYYASPDVSVKDEIRNFLSPIATSNVSDLSQPEVNPNELYITSFNIPESGVKTLFSLNLKESFYDISQEYYHKHKDRLDSILDFSYGNIVKFYGETLAGKYTDNKIKESSFKHLLTSFEGGYDAKFDNEKVKFSKEFKDYNIDIIEYKISGYLNEIYKNDTTNE
jgi:hypothetical protein